MWHTQINKKISYCVSQKNFFLSKNTKKSYTKAQKNVKKTMRYLFKNKNNRHQIILEQTNLLIGQNFIGSTFYQANPDICPTF
jgi:hypothetical protein